MARLRNRARDHRPVFRGNTGEVDEQTGEVTELMPDGTRRVRRPRGSAASTVTMTVNGVPRLVHVALDGSVIPVAEDGTVPGSDFGVGFAQAPRSRDWYADTLNRTNLRRFTAIVEVAKVARSLLAHPSPSSPQAAYWERFVNSEAARLRVSVDQLYEVYHLEQAERAFELYAENQVSAQEPAMTEEYARTLESRREKRLANREEKKRTKNIRQPAAPRKPTTRELLRGKKK